MELQYSAPVFWASVSALASLRNMSLSALALKAGLDAGALNPSKANADRFPSMETICKILEAAQVSVSQWAELTDFLADFNERNPYQCPNPS